MSTFDLQNPTPLSGDLLRDEVGNLLSVRLGDGIREKRVCGKKVDLYFEQKYFGKITRIYVECKDYNRNLKREEVVSIFYDYFGLLEKSLSRLLIVTRNGLTPDGQSCVDENSRLAHQTIWQLESETLGINSYVRHLAALFGKDGLKRYYIETRGRHVSYDFKSKSRVLDVDSVDLFAKAQAWIASESYAPMAFLGGYGAGKTSLATKIASYQAERSLQDPHVRIPVLLRLGQISRYASLDGFLGGMFTNEFPTTSFNFSFFMKLNARGRLLVILDGFDEMKHAMTWGDFRAQIHDLNRLVEGHSKVLLLGRPSAFISFEEHVHVLRGRKVFGDDFRRLPDWPEFSEYDIDGFTPAERNAFFDGYLRYRFLLVLDKSVIEDNWLENRISELQSLAVVDEEVFSKPIHAKILADLASDPKIDLASLSGKFNRWLLYETFFVSLAEREVEKVSRRGVGEEKRLWFLQEMAFWLWTEKSGVTSFYADDIPDRLFLEISDADSDIDALKREMLTGAFLEKKSGGIFYFAHRSFAEFLVARRMLQTDMAAADHSKYASIIRDGVLLFLTEAGLHSKVRGWASSLSKARGVVNCDYLGFIRKSFTSTEEFASCQDRDSLISILSGCYFGDGDMNSQKLQGRLVAKMHHQSNEVFYTVVGVFLTCISPTLLKRELQLQATIIAAVALNRLFETATRDVTSRRWSIEASYKDARFAAINLLSDAYSGYNERTMTLSIVNIAKGRHEVIRQSGVEINCHVDDAFPADLPANVVLRVSDIQRIMRPETRDKFVEFLRDATSLKTIFAKGYK